MKAAILGCTGIIMGIFSDTLFHDAMQTIAIVGGAVASTFGAVNGWIEWRRKQLEKKEEEQE